MHFGGERASLLGEDECTDDPTARRIDGLSHVCEAALSAEKSCLTGDKLAVGEAWIPDVLNFWKKRINKMSVI